MLLCLALCSLLRYHDAMSIDRVGSALEQLRAERAEVGTRLAAMQREMHEVAAQLQRLDVAIAALGGGEPDGGFAADAKLVRPAAVSEDLDVPRLRLDAPKGSMQRIAPFITRGVGKERDGLQSAKMVAAVVDYLGEPVSPEKLKVAFFDHFDRDLLKEHYWQDPDKAFRSALRRAVERDTINEVQYPDDGGVVYISGWRIARGARLAQLREMRGD